VALLVGIPFLVVIAAFFAVGAATQARAHGNAFTQWLINASAIGVFLLGPIAKLGVNLARWITNEIGKAATPLLHMGATWLSGLAQWASVVIENALLWPYELSKFAYWLLDVYLPRLLKTIPHIAGQVVHSVTSRVVRIERTVVKLPKLSKAAAHALVAAAVATYVHPFLSDLRWLQRHFHALTAVLPRALPIPTVPAFPNVWKRLRALERRIGVPVALGVVATAIARLGVGWIRCNKVRQLGRAACGMDDSLLASILLDSLAIFSILSVVEFATELRAVEDEAIAIMGRLVREWPA
jgi:hypothetical protein